MHISELYYSVLNINIRRIIYSILFYFFIVITLSGCHPLYGFIESEFELAKESSLPRWIKVDSFNRPEVNVYFTFYTFDKVRISVKGLEPENKILFEKVGLFRWHPITEHKFKEQKNKYNRSNYS